MPQRFPPRVPREHINNLPPMTQDDLDTARKEFPDEKLASCALEKYAKKHWIEGRYFWKDGFRYVCGSGMLTFQSMFTKNLGLFEGATYLFGQSQIFDTLQPSFLDSRGKIAVTPEREHTMLPKILRH